MLHSVYHDLPGDGLMGGQTDMLGIEPEVLEQLIRVPDSPKRSRIPIRCNGAGY